MTNEIISSIMHLSREMNNGFDITAKALRKQKSFNHRIAILALVAAGYVIVSERRYGEQQAKIKKLTRELEELKDQKGE